MSLDKNVMLSARPKGASGVETPAKLIIKTAKLVPYLKRSKALPSYATAYNFEPEPSQAEALGNLLVVIEILAIPKQAEAVADLVIQTLGDNFYNFKSSADESSKPPSTYDRFEAAVRSVNHGLAEYAEQGHAGWVGRLSAILAVQSGDQLHITQAGSANGYLYRHGKVTHITAEMSAVGPHRPGTSFSSIASGRLEIEDRILLATPALFHQISRTRLSEIIDDNSPETGVTKLSELINQSPHSDRVAALIIEVTSPELMAMQRGVESTDTEVKVGQPDSLIDNAKEVAAPVVTEGLDIVKRAGQAAIRRGRTTVIPKIKSLAIASAQATSRAARHPKQRRWLWLVSAVIAITIGWLIYLNVNSSRLDALASRYNRSYTSVETARTQIANGDKAAARQSLVTAATELDQLSKLPQARLIDLHLSKRARPEGDPGSINTLKAEINSLIDQIDGLITVSPQDLSGLENLNDFKATNLEAVGGKLVLIDVAGALVLYDIASSQAGSPVKNPALGKIIASTASSNDDGIYILTDTPAVWFFKLDGTLTRQSTSFGAWPKGRSIASYSGNLYILSDDSSQIYKHTRNLGGFSGKANYFTPEVSPAVSGSAALAVDGAIYTAGSSGLKRFLAGKPEGSTSLPATLSQPSAVQSTSAGDLILISDTSSGRLGIVVVNGTQLTLTKQITLTNKTKLLDSKADPGGKTVYGLTDTKLVKFALPR